MMPIHDFLIAWAWIDCGVREKFNIQELKCASNRRLSNCQIVIALLDRLIFAAIVRRGVMKVKMD